MLREVAKPVADPTSAQVRGLIQSMVETMMDADGAGLAAPQVHMPVRLVIFQASPERSTEPDDGEEHFDHTAPLTVLINPEIEFLTEETELGMEGCLSVPGLRGLVPRCTHIRYSGVNEKGEPINREARGFHARVVLHECDHLDGILYPQRMEDLSQLLFESELKHYAEPDDTERDDAEPDNAEPDNAEPAEAAE